MSNQDWQIDMEIISAVSRLDALRAKMQLAWRNGAQKDFYEYWAQIHELSRSVGWRLNELRPKPIPVPVLEPAEEVE